MRQDGVQIEKWLDAGVCRAEIARRLGVARSTVCREVARRSWTPSDTAAPTKAPAPAREA